MNENRTVNVELFDQGTLPNERALNHPYFTYETKLEGPNKLELGDIE